MKNNMGCHHCDDTPFQKRIMTIVPRYSFSSFMCILLLTGLFVSTAVSADSIPMPQSDKTQNRLLQNDTQPIQPKTPAPIVPSWLTDTIQRILTGGAQWETIKRSDGRPTPTP